ncbi:hypothetical protein NPX13_g10279 [Xylaria arbuscula]|uniref:Uncharacterized protein n=1 Tax=Xylaria arbuscula TaxID=114810 RepID=A0A9W8THM6_9PEZI|nr:hypothetical protein NPX13_g10279 [Xylaria arbuscula]
MEEAAKSIKTLAEQILPKQPYYLTLSPTRKYQVHPDETRFDEQDIRPLQYTTLVGGEADRGVLLTRAYYTVREEPNARTNAPTPTTLKIDPSKPRKVLSLKDYKNKKAEGDSPPKLEVNEKPNGLATIKERDEIKKRADPTPKKKEMDSRRDAKKHTANIKSEVRHHSPSPDRRKRAAGGDDGHKPVKRVKVEDAASNGTTLRPSRDASSQKPVRNIPSAKGEPRDTKTFATTNGRPASSNSALRAASPKHTPQVNGTGKTSAQASHKRAVSNGESVPKTVPRLLSPLFIADLSIEKPVESLKETASESRPSPKKRPVETNSLKPPLNKKPRNEREPSPSAKRRKVVPPLLSPTLPPAVMDELAKSKKLGTPLKDTPSKEPSSKNNHVSDSVIVKKPPKSTQEETIHVDNKKEPTKFVVTMKYKKRNIKRVERLLNLPPDRKKKAEGLKKEDHAGRESSVSVEPGTARKRPRITADATEASQRSKTSESLRPTTPPKQSTSMSRIASNSSQVGTPGAANTLTPSTQPPHEKRRESGSADVSEKLQRASRCHAGHQRFMELGRNLKHERDAIMKVKENPTEHEHHAALAAGIQSLLSYMHAVKLQCDAHDLEKVPRRFICWKEILPLFGVFARDCQKGVQNTQLEALLALIYRIQGIFMNHMERTLWFIPIEPNMVKELVKNSKDQSEVWRQSEQWRRKLDGGTVGKLIDRLGPWSTIEEALPLSLEILRNVVSTDGPWKPNDGLARFERPSANGSRGP